MQTIRGRRGWPTAILLLLGVLAFSWYGAVGETGPIGWLNGLQAASSGSYSRVVSFGLLFVAVLVVGGGALGLWLFFKERVLGRVPAPSAAPHPAMKVLFEPTELPAPRVGWKGSLAILLALLACAWIATLGWHAWDWHQRSVDAGSDYAPLRLGRDVVPARPADGSHLALQGRLLWDHALVRRTTNGAAQAETVFLPMAGADWRPGDAVHIVIQLEPSGAYSLQHRTGGDDAPLRVRVEGALPGATRPVFAQGGAPASDAAVLVEVVDTQAGPMVDARPAFDRASATLIGGGLSAFIALLWLTAVLTFKLKTWVRRRRAAR